MLRAANLAELAPAAADDPACGGKRVGILVVTYNAAATISKVLKRIPPPVWSNVEEVVIFDDASSDGTYEMAVGLQTLSANTKLHVLKNERNLGYGGNQKSGYRYFIEKGFDVVVLLHGDGQYAPEVLARLYHPIVTGQADAVFGSRMMQDYGGPLKGGMPLYKYAGNRILTYFENRALSMHLTEFHSGYRAYSVSALAKLQLGRMTDDFHFDTEIIIKLNHQGFRIHEVPIPTYYGGEICHVNGLKYAWDVVRAVRRYDRTRNSLAKYPEFEEYFIQYAIKKSPHSSHEFAREAVGTGQEVLDIGCGEALLAAEFQRAGNRVWGIDSLRQAKRAFEMEGYAQVDLEEGLGPLWQGRRYDKILLLDILEHLRNPENLLTACLPLLRPNGNVIVSVPNAVNLSVRLMVLFGRFTYSERGILDRTHLRFYSRKTARALLEENGFKILQHRMTIIPAEFALGMPPESLPVRIAQRILIFLTYLVPGLFGYQSFLIARAASAHPVTDSRSPHR